MPKQVPEGVCKGERCVLAQAEPRGDVRLPQHFLHTVPCSLAAEHATWCSAQIKCSCWQQVVTPGTAGGGTSLASPSVARSFSTAARLAT